MRNLRTLSILDSAMHSFSALRSTANQFKSSISPFVFHRFFPSLKYVFPPNSCFDNFAFCLSQVFLTFTINYPWLFFSVPGDGVKNSRKWAQPRICLSLRECFHFRPCWEEGKTQVGLSRIPSISFLSSAPSAHGNFRKVSKTCNIAKNKHKA